jgi:putative transposase
MGMGRPKAELILSEAEQVQLALIARSRSTPAALVQRSRIVLACASGEPNNAVAERFETTELTVGKWRRRFVKDRIQGLYDELQTRQAANDRR